MSEGILLYSQTKVQYYKFPLITVDWVGPWIVCPLQYCSVAVSK